MPDFSGLKDGLKGKNICIAACSVTGGNKGQELISIIAKQTKSSVYASDHNTSGLFDLGGRRYPYISYTGFGRIPFSYNSRINNFNDYHVSYFGSKAKSTFDLKISSFSGWIGTTATDFYSK